MPSPQHHQPLAIVSLAGLVCLPSTTVAVVGKRRVGGTPLDKERWNLTDTRVQDPEHESAL